MYYCGVKLDNIFYYANDFAVKVAKSGFFNPRAAHSMLFYW